MKEDGREQAPPLARRDEAVLLGTPQRQRALGHQLQAVARSVEQQQGVRHAAGRVAKVPPALAAASLAPAVVAGGWVMMQWLGGGRDKGPGQ